MEPLDFDGGEREKSLVIGIMINDHDNDYDDDDEADDDDDNDDDDDDDDGRNTIWWTLLTLMEAKGKRVW